MNDPEVKYNAQVVLDYQPTFIKHISGLWLLVAGKDPFAEIYSANTMRKVKVVETPGRVISAEGNKQYCIIGNTNKEIFVYSLRELQLVKRLSTLQPPTTMCLLRENILVYGLGDEGYGCVQLAGNFIMFE